MTDTFTRENKLVDIILNEKLDDVLGELDKDDDRRDVLIDLGDKLSHFINHKVNEIYNFLKDNYKGNRKDFAIKFNKHVYFAFAIKVTYLSDEGEIQTAIYNNYINYLKKETSKLERARIFLSEKLDFKLFDYFHVN